MRVGDECGLGCWWLAVDGPVGARGCDASSRLVGQKVTVDGVILVVTVVGMPSSTLSCLALGFRMIPSFLITGIAQ